MTPEELAQVKTLIEEHDFKSEPWSWKKFISGFFNGQNYAKALVLGVCFIIILIIVLSVGSMIKSRLKKPTQSIGTNSGTVVTNNEDKHGNSFSLFNILNGR